MFKENWEKDFGGLHKPAAVLQQREINHQGSGNLLGIGILRLRHRASAKIRVLKMG
jgi:hypothetical protein